MPTTTERGYGNEHQKERARWRPQVDAGQAHCAEIICLKPTRTIYPGTSWDLAHDRRTGGYLGPAHMRCNRAEGAAYGNRQRGNARPKHRWRSRQW